MELKNTFPKEEEIQNSQNADIKYAALRTAFLTL